MGSDLDFRFINAAFSAYILTDAVRIFGFLSRTSNVKSNKIINADEPKKPT